MWHRLLIMCLLLCHKSKQKYVIDHVITSSKTWHMQDWYSDGKNHIISMKQKQKWNAVITVVNNYFYGIYII